MSDIEVSNQGSIVLVRPLNEEARDWLHENVDQAAQWWAGALAVEPRYLDPLVDGLIDAGFTVA